MPKISLEESLQTSPFSLWDIVESTLPRFSKVLIPKHCGPYIWACEEVPSLLERKRTHRQCRCKRAFRTCTYMMHSAMRPSIKPSTAGCVSPGVQTLLVGVGAPVGSRPGPDATVSSNLARHEEWRPQWVDQRAIDLEGFGHRHRRAHYRVLSPFSAFPVSLSTRAIIVPKRQRSNKPVFLWVWGGVAVKLGPLHQSRAGEVVVVTATITC